jgi:cysteine desulfurase
MAREVYLDYAATTPTDERVLEAMQPYFNKMYGNPSSLHTKGREAREVVDEARGVCADFINARPDEIIFTGGGTESDNMAILGYARAQKDAGKHIIVSAIEHHAVLEAAQFLETNEGFEVTYLKPDKTGRIDPKQVKDALRNDTILVSIMFANNEIGTVQPIEEIGEVIDGYRDMGGNAHIAFHSDACQASTSHELDVDVLNLDFLTLNGSKAYGPKGVGLLYMTRGRNITPLHFGGGQERGMCPGTLNVPGIVGMAKAFEVIQRSRTETNRRIANLRDMLVDGLVNNIENTTLNGHPEHRLPGHANVSFKGIDAETGLIFLDQKGIYVSTGAACSSGSVEPSHVLEATGADRATKSGALRFTVGRQTTEDDIAYVLQAVPGVIAKLRG